MLTSIHQIEREKTVPQILLNEKSRPTIKQLQEVMRIEDIDITTQWRNLGLELVDSNKTLKVIEADHPSDVNACCRLMFEKWLEAKSDASWSQLVIALENIKMYTAANAISKLFKSGNQNEEKSKLTKIKTPAEASIEFGMLMREIIRELKKNENESLEVIKDLCPYLTAQDDEKVLLFSADELRAIDGCSDIRRMFKENLRECWRWDDFSLLTKLVQYINSSVCKSLLNKYQQSLNYKMKLKEICEHRRQEKRDLPDGYSAMFAIVEKNFFEITLEEFLELKDFISRYCGVEPWFMSPVVNAGPYSSILFEWYIPLTAISYMVKVATSNTDVFIQRSFVLLKISSAMIFDRRVDENWTPLYYATKYGQATVVEALLKSASVEMINRWGTLHTAARYGHVPVVDSLIKLGADVNTVSMENWTPLLTAARNDHAAVIETLINSGADVNGGNLDKWTPLECAVRHGHVKVVEALIRSGADVNANNMDKWTPLHISARHGHAAVAETLIKAGAKINAGNTSKWTPLHTAARQGHVKVVQIMINFGADLASTDSKKWTALHSATEQGHILVVEVLVGSGADVNALTNDGWSPLHLAAEYNRIQVLKCLIKSGANVCAATKDEKYTPLHLAAQNGHVQAVETLLKSGANINAITIEKQTPLHIAARNGKNAVVETLIIAGVNINACDKNLNSPLHLATKHDHIDVVDLLGRAGADVSIVNKNQRTPLHIAIYRDNVSLVKKLISFGADVNASIGPLEEAVRCKKKNVVIYFIEELMIKIDTLELDEPSQIWIKDLLEERRSPTSCSCM